jgi:signal transduction histidine kinase
VTGERRFAEPLARLHAILGAPGLMIGLFSILSLWFGLYVLAREYHRLRNVGREALRPAISTWIRTVPVHYLGQTLADYADGWRRAPWGERNARLTALRQALAVLGNELHRPSLRAPLVEIEALDLVIRGERNPLASWRPPGPLPPDPDELTDRLPLLDARSGTAVDIVVRYRLAPDIERAAAGLETSYHRLLLGLVGASGYALLCLGAMVLHVRALRDRVAKEAAQAATIDLADRTCHELGNVAFVLTNERRNLANHLDLIEQFVAEERSAVEAAARRAGLDSAQVERLCHALRREYADRGIDPTVELLGGTAIARDVCRQVAVCSEYIALTVRELDAYLKQSQLPVAVAATGLRECVEDALSLLGPALQTAGAIVEVRSDPSEPTIAVADRRLLVHALVNLLKNAVEAGALGKSVPRIEVSIRAENDRVQIEVADNGPGISSSEMPQIFDLGYSTKGPGRGRGLTIVRDSIEAQGGELGVSSEPGKGTRFSIVLARATTADCKM